MKKLITLLILCSLGISFGRAQSLPQLSLNECYTLAKQNYPLVKQRELITKTAAYTIDNLQKGYLPQLTINGQASYQSAVTEIPIKLPGMNVPVIKDQYKVYGEINQTIYDGGTIGGQKELQKTNEVVEQQKLETELYKLKERINQLYFGVLLLDEQLKQNNLLIKDLQLGLSKVQASIDNGIALKSNGDVLKADILKNKQHAIELRASRKAYTDMLSLFTGAVVDEATVLVKPEPVVASTQINRPELLAYDAQNKTLDVQNKLITAKALPKFSFYFQGGMGRPALNMLSNSFDAFYVGGLRLTWSPSVFYTAKKDRALIDINRRTIALQKETFLFNTNLSVKQQSAETGKYEELLASDDEIITLRGRVKTTLRSAIGKRRNKC
jgi:outer membrane protein TolC